MQKSLSSQLNFNITDRDAGIFLANQADKINILNEWQSYPVAEDDDQGNIKNFEYQKSSLEEPERLTFLFQNYKQLSVNQIDNIMNDFVKNKINFDEIINIISSSPSGELLDLAKSALRRYDDNEYEIIKTYLYNDEASNYVKSYFIETIIDWDLIDSNKRLRDLKELLDKLENENVFTRSIKFAIAELS